ncbi:MAG: glutathione S-transferase C-terminal domain-containing protein [Terrimicrobiaceae bacterium]
MRWKAWAVQRAELSEAAGTLLEPYDLALQHRPFLFGATPLYADFALFGILENLTYRDHNPLPKELDTLGQWFARMKAFLFN